MKKADNFNPGQWLIENKLNEGSNIQSIYEKLFSTNNELDNWLTDNASTSEAVKIKRKGAEYFDAMTSILVKKGLKL
jgi:hypothetical protein